MLLVQQRASSKKMIDKLIRVGDGASRLNGTPGAFLESYGERALVQEPGRRGRGRWLGWVGESPILRILIGGLRSFDHVVD